MNRHFIPLVEHLPEDFWRVEIRAQELPTDPVPLKVEILRRMHLIRAFEKALGDAFARGELPTEAVHLSIGQEATAVGVCFALRADDYMTTTQIIAMIMKKKGLLTRNATVHAPTVFTNIVPTSS